MFLTLINALIALHSGLNPPELYPPNYGPNLKNGDEFDFIIIGAGSAGSLLANRLSAIPEWKILLLEAGGYPSGLSEIPPMMFSLQETDEDWQYITEQSSTCCLGFQNKVCKIPRGRGLGGSSLINLMMYTRSTKYDHDRWVREGNDGWDYNSVNEYYKKFENAHIENNKHYGTNGELHLTRYTTTQPIRHILAKAYEELGYHEYTEDEPLGFKDVLLSVYQSTRHHAGKAFLSSAKDRKNLYVATNSQVSKILVDREKLTAFGVEVKIGEEILKLTGKKEVIVSAGSVNSPQILMNSGIGPKESLSKIGIDVLKDLMVGENYQDHIAFPFVAVGIDQSAVVSPTSLQLLNEVYQFFMHRQGELTKIELLNFAGFINTKNHTNVANIHFVHTIIHQNDPYALPEMLRASGVSEDAAKTLLDYNKKTPFILFVPILLHPKSSGRISLQNDDPFSKPVITPNYLSDQNSEDIEALLNAIKFIIKLTETKEFSSYNPKFLDLNITNCIGFVPQSDDFWKCAIRNIGFPVYHPLGTCKMGPSSDSLAVVDPQLRVHGVSRLRVIDASIMPMTPSCTTNAPSFMIGEKGADLIKKEWLNTHDEL